MFFFRFANAHQNLIKLNYIFKCIQAKHVVNTETNREKNLKFEIFAFSHIKKHSFLKWFERGEMG